jgi:hypothetical protein
VVDRVTVGGLRRWLEGFDQDATVVVQAGMGYEEPKIVLKGVKPVTVRQRYLYNSEGDKVVALVPINGS